MEANAALDAVPTDDGVEACRKVIRRRAEIGPTKEAGDGWAMSAAAGTLFLRERLVDEGRRDDAVALMQAVVDGFAGMGSDIRLVRHRYWLALAALESGRTDIAKRHLNVSANVIFRWAPTVHDMALGWQNVYYSELHLLHVGWGRYQIARGVLDDAFRELESSRVTFQRALETKIPQVLRLRPITQALFEIDVYLVSGRYARALELADAAIESHGAAASELNRMELLRKRAVALSELAILGKADALAGATALREMLAYDNFDLKSRLDTKYRLCQALASVEQLDEAREVAQSVDRGELEGFDRALSSAMLVDVARHEDRAQLATSLRDDMGAMIDGWLAQPAKPDGTGQLHIDKVGYILNAAVEAELASDDREGAPERALNLMLQLLDAHDLARRMGAQPTRHEALQEALRPGEAGLLFLTSDQGGHGFLVSSDDVRVFPILGTKQVRQAVLPLRTASQDATGGSGDWRQLATELRDAILPEDVRSELAEAETVFMFAQDTVFDAPIGLIPIDGTPLSLRCSVAHIPSPAILVALRRLESRSSSGTTIIANVPGSDWVDPLERAFADITVTDEALAHWAKLGGKNSAVLTGAAGSVQAVLDGALAGRSVGVVYAHGDVVPDQGRPNGLLLGGLGGAFENGRLGAVDIERSASADIVILATCRAGRGPIRTGSGGTNHAGGAFQLAGARSVVLSSNDLPARATAALTEAILHRLSLGKSIGEALQGAKLELSEQQEFSHPATWASLELFGLPEIASPSLDGVDRQPVPLRLALGLAALAGITWLALSRKRKRPRTS